MGTGVSPRRIATGKFVTNLLITKQYNQFLAATEQVDDLPGYGMPGLILRAAYVKQQTIMIKAPAASDLGLLVCTAPYDGYTEGDYENTPPVQALADTPGFAGYDKYWYFDLNELTKE